MKKKIGNSKRSKIIVLFAFLIISLGFAVSCRAEQTVPEDSDACAWVEFELEDTRDISLEYTPEDYNDLYWFYSAVKNDDYGTYGATGTTENIFFFPVAYTAYEEKKELTFSKGLSSGKSGIGPFSLGSWTFKLVAYSDCTTTTEDSETNKLLFSVVKDDNATYTNGTTNENETYYLKDENLIYSSEEVTVFLSDTTSPTKVSASVSPKGEKGLVSVKNQTITCSANKIEIIFTRIGSTKGADTSSDVNSVTISSEDAMPTDGTLKIEKTKSNQDNSNTYTISGSKSLNEGMYKCELKESDTTNSAWSCTFAVYPNTTTTISWAESK